jgi:FkbM family methyltransferase
MIFATLPNSPLELKNLVLSESVKALKFNTFLDNFDIDRFNYDGVDRSKIFNTSERVYWLSWFSESSEKIFKAYDLLNSERSKRLYLNLLAYRIAGHHSMRIFVRFNEDSPEFTSYLTCEKSSNSKVSLDGMFGKLKHYDFFYKGKHYVLDCLGLKYYLFRNQYFFEDGETRIMPAPGDFVVDAGACLGDTAIVFGKAVGATGRVYAFDPVQNHLEVLKFNANQNPDCQIQVMECGLSDVDVYCPPIRLQAYAPGFNSRTQQVPLSTLDGLVSRGEIEKIDFIKMDIEGAELSALRGASACINRFRPKLAISLYHKPTDIFEIPIFIADSFPFYEMHIDHYTIHQEETVLYCAPRI